MAASGDWTCTACEQDNEADDEFCTGCGEEPPQASVEEKGGALANFRIGVVESVESIPKKDKLSALKVNVGLADAEPLSIVTNAKNVKVGSRIVVAMVGAKVTVNGEDIVVAKSSVGGRKSEGMVCDGAMLGWKGGGSGAVTLSGEYVIGAAPPTTRPRPSGK